MRIIYMKLPSTISKILTNKYVLYFIAFLSLTNVLGYAMRGDLNHIIVFMLLGVIMTYFSKNMSIVLLVSLLLANLFSLCIVVREGFEDGKDGEENDKKESHQEDDQTGEQGDNKKEKKNPIKKTESKVGESFEVGRGKRNPKIDYASTITDAYSQLNELIGKDGIKSLTNDTQTLMQQQLQLADSMKAIGPLIEGITPLLSQVKGMMGGMDSNSLDGIKSLAKTFSASAGQQDQ
jgi:hypothetical protein